jgi:hypothetical protein
MCHVQEWDDHLMTLKRIPKLPSYDFWRKAIGTLHDVANDRFLLTCYPSNGGRPNVQTHVSVDDEQYQVIFSNQKTHVQPSSRTNSPIRSSARHLLNLTDSLKENIHFRKVTSQDYISSSSSSVSCTLLFIQIYDTI